MSESALGLDRPYVKQSVKEGRCPGPLCFTWMSHHFEKFHRERLEWLIITIVYDIDYNLKY